MFYCPSCSRFFPNWQGTGNHRRHCTSLHSNGLIEHKENTLLEEACLHDSVDMESFLDKLPTYSDKEVVMSKLLRCKRLAKLSRDAGNALLELIRSFEPNKFVPRDWDTVTRYLHLRSHQCYKAFF